MRKASGLIVFVFAILPCLSQALPEPKPTADYSGYWLAQGQVSGASTGHECLVRLVKVQDDVYRIWWFDATSVSGRGLGKVTDGVFAGGYVDAHARYGYFRYVADGTNAKPSFSGEWIIDKGLDDLATLKAKERLIFWRKAGVKEP